MTKGIKQFARNDKMSRYQRKMYEKRGEENTLAKIDENSVPCVVGVMMLGSEHHVVHIAFVSCRRSIRLMRIQPKGRARGLARSTLPSFDMVRGQQVPQYD
jgi:hypothetical protein